MANTTSTTLQATFRFGNNPDNDYTFKMSPYQPSNAAVTNFKANVIQWNTDLESAGAGEIAVGTPDDWQTCTAICAAMITTTESEDINFRS